MSMSANRVSNECRKHSHEESGVSSDARLNRDMQPFCCDARINCLTHYFLLMYQFLILNRGRLPFRAISYERNWRGAYCRTGPCLQVYYRHLAHLFDRFNSLEVAISFIREIDYRSNVRPQWLHGFSGFHIYLAISLDFSLDRIFLSLLQYPVFVKIVASVSFGNSWFRYSQVRKTMQFPCINGDTRRFNEKIFTLKDLIPQIRSVLSDHQGMCHNQI